MIDRRCFIRHVVRGSAAVALLACARAPSPESEPAPPADAAATKPPVEVPLITVELTHDLICPWCRIGHHRLKAAIAAYGKPVTVRYRAFQLEPSTPPEGFDLRARLAAKYGAQSLDTMFARVTAIGKQDGLVFDFAKVTRTPPTLPGHLLVDAAPAAKQEALVDALHQAYFVDGQDIGKREVLVAAAATVGLDAAWVDGALDDEHRQAKVAAEAREASKSGIGGVPHFVVTGPAKTPSALHGAQPVDALVKALGSA